MKKFYITTAMIFLALGFSMNVLGQKVRNSYKQNVRMTSQQSVNSTGKVMQSRIQTMRGNRIGSPENGAKTQSRSVVFEPNDEPLWVRSRVRKNAGTEVSLFDGSVRRTVRTETVGKDETITIQGIRTNLTQRESGQSLITGNNGGIWKIANFNMQRERIIAGNEYPGLTKRIRMNPTN